MFNSLQSNIYIYIYSIHIYLEREREGLTQAAWKRSDISWIFRHIFAGSLVVSIMFLWSSTDLISPRNYSPQRFRQLLVRRKQQQHFGSLTMTVSFFCPWEWYWPWFQVMLYVYPRWTFQAPSGIITRKYCMSETKSCSVRTDVNLLARWCLVVIFCKGSQQKRCLHP